MRVALLGSGRGTNAEAILSAWKAGNLGNAEIIGIISDKEDARILELGKKYNINAQYLFPGEFKTKLEGEAELQYIKLLNEWKVDLVVLVGFMRVLKPTLLQAFEGKIINLHPSLLPAFPGLNAMQQAWDYGVKVAGCTVHWVSDVVDGGQVIDQEPVFLTKEDTVQSFEDKMHAAEHVLMPRVLAQLSKESVYQ